MEIKSQIRLKNELEIYNANDFLYFENGKEAIEKWESEHIYDCEFDKENKYIDEDSFYYILDMIEDSRYIECEIENILSDDFCLIGWRILLYY